MMGKSMTDEPGRALLAMQLGNLICGTDRARDILHCAAWALAADACYSVREMLASQLRALICADPWSLAVMADTAKVLESDAAAMAAGAVVYRTFSG